MERSIIHINVADFAVAVERVCDSRLRGRPVLVAAAGGRAAVFDMSEEAYRAGVRKGMPLWVAKKFVRDAVVLPPSPARYSRAMNALFKQAQGFAPRLEVADGTGHLFLDVTGTHRLLGPAPDIAWRLRRETRRDLAFDPIWTVAPNKLVAKVASRVVKPAGEYIVAAGEEAAFLAPQPVALIPGVSREEVERLADFNLTRAGQVAALTQPQLAIPFGQRAQFLHEVMQGLDETPVLTPGTGTPAVRLRQAFPEDVWERPLVEQALRDLTRQAGGELRARARAARRVGILLEYADGDSVVRQVAARQPVADDSQLFSLACLALARAWTRRVRLRALELACDRLVSAAVQLALFPDQETARARREKASAALDAVRQRYGEEGLIPGPAVSSARERKAYGLA